MNRWIRWFPCVAWMGAIFYLSSRTGDELGSLLPIFQRIVPAMQGFDWGHFFAYFGLALTYWWALSVRRDGIGIKVLAVALCLLYGITDEYHQSFVPGRSPDVMDLRNDGIGAALAMLFVSIPVVGSGFDRLRRAINC